MEGEGRGCLAYANIQWKKRLIFGSDKERGERERLVSWFPGYLVPYLYTLIEPLISFKRFFCKNFRSGELASNLKQCFGSGSFCPEPDRTFFPESRSAKNSGSDPENPDP